MFKSVGRLVFDPQYTGQDNIKPFWLMVACDEEIARYYRYLLLKEHGIRLNPRCLWGAHISVVRGERPLAGWWGKIAGEEIGFEYDGIVRDNSTYYWMDITCKRLSEIRISYGLSPNPYFGFHLTIGNNVT